ncbi:MAG TPA: hypothetical protein VN380_14635 [Thermoanaerobaculia bacterium]|nr:hypothetical protein [Thermoanaerobaculia bacterium]
MRPLLASIVLLAAALAPQPALAQFVQHAAKLVGTGALDTSLQGSSVAVSADGNTAIVGGVNGNGSSGAAWIWTKNGGLWTQQSGPLTGSDSGPTSHQGFSVAISADGNTAIVGGNNDGNGVGAAWIWSRSGGVWTQQGPKLVGSDTVGRSGQGFSVALSADSNTAIVGAPGDNQSVGAAWVWTRSVGVWFQQGPKLLVPSLATLTQFGYSVCLSSDGNTAVIGGINDDKGIGAAWVWSRNGESWSVQGSKLVGSGYVNTPTIRTIHQGSSVALSADGNTIVVGGANDSFGAGAVWIWTKSSSGWTQQGEKLAGAVAPDALAYQGTSVAVSADGNIVVAGGNYDLDQAGAAWVWIRSAGVWSQQSTKLLGAGVDGPRAQQGCSVSISADGNTVIIGGPLDDNQVGAAWVWNRSGSAWTQPQPKLISSGAVGHASQGGAVALSADGNTAIVGGANDNPRGAAWIWTRSGGVWSQQAKLIGSGAVVGNAGASRQGYSVALSADGNTAIVGAPLDNNYAGAAWVWTRAEGVWTQQGTKLVGSGGVGSSTQQGSAVALSADGNTAIVGGVGDQIVFDGRSYDGYGAAWVWTRNGGVWTQQGPKLTGLNVSFGISFFNIPVQQGCSVSLSADGNTAIVGGSGDNGVNGARGAAWVFVRNGGVWTQQAAKLTRVGAGNFGVSVALSADGNTAIIGEEYDHASGSAWIWTRSGNLWTQQPTRLSGSDAAVTSVQGTTINVHQGYSVAISADGNTAIVGGYGDNLNAGAAWIWRRSGGIWTQLSSKLVGSDAVGASIYQGVSVALSGDGQTAIVGGFGDNSSAGAAWVFNNVVQRRRVVKR